MMEESVMTHSSRYLECVNCHKPIILHWYMRHANKCIDSADKKTFAKAAQAYHSATAGGDKIQSLIPMVAPKTTAGESMDKVEMMQKLDISQATLNRYCLLLEDAGHQIPVTATLRGGRAARVFRPKDLDALKTLIEYKTLGKSVVAAAREVAAKFNPTELETTAAPNETADMKTRLQMLAAAASENVKQVLEQKQAQDPAEPVVAPEEAVEEVDKKLAEPKEEDKKLLESFRSAPGAYAPVSEFNPKYKDWLECTVERIESYGVLVRMNEYHYIKGLIHKTNVRPGARHAVDLDRYFRVGDTVRAQVVDLSKKKKNQVGLSTAESVDLPDYALPEELTQPTPIHTESMPSALADALLKNKDRLKELKVKAQQEPEVQSMPTSIKPAPSAPAEAVYPEDSQDVKDVISFVHGKIGAVSPAAYAKIKELLEEYGMFSFMMKLMETHSRFSPDLGLIFAREVETKLRDSL